MDKINNVYLEQFKKIPFYQLHPSYIPFVGDNYEKYRILQISESHYCEEITDRDKYGIPYFVDWFTSDSDDIETKYLDHDLTRKVCNGVMENNSFANFDNPLRSFCEVVLGLGKLSMNKGNQNRKYYSYFSFMNFYQVPALENKAPFKKAFYKEAENKKIENPDEIITKWRRESVGLIDQVIDILKPRAVAFTSVDAWESYDENKGRHRESPIIIRSAHPNRPWNNSQPKLNGKTGKAAFEDGLRRIYSSKQ